MKTPLQKILFFLLIIILISLATMQIFVWQQIRGTFYLHRPASTYTLEQFGLTGTPHTIITADHLKLDALHIPAKDSKATIVIVHGASDDGGKTVMLPYAKFLAEAGYSSITFGLRNYATSEGNKTTFGVKEWQDVVAAYNLAKQVEPNKPVGLLGVSMGSASLITAMGKENIGEFAVASVPYTTFGSGASWDAQFKYGLPQWFTRPFIDVATLMELGPEYFSNQPLYTISNVKVPILLVAARNDQKVNPQDTYELQRLGGDKIQVWESSVAAHDVLNTDGDAYKAQLLSFLKEISSPTTGGNSSSSSSTAATTTSKSNEIPQFTQKVVVAGLSHPWDMVMLADHSFIFTERPNKISYYKNGKVTPLNSPTDTYVRGEGGMLGLAIDPEFASNNFIYTCFNSEAEGPVDVRVVRYKFDQNALRLTNRRNIITNMPSISSGRHSGCQLEFGPDGYLWVGTGDAAQDNNPQSRNSLGGKILRVDRDGKAAPDNLGQGFDPRIYNYGHRNVQGLGFFRNDAGFSTIGLSIEQGSTVNDEVNVLVKGNFGWDPNPGYSESGVPMTDLNKFPNAIRALWSSGDSTEATSGGTIINSPSWKAWDQALMVAVQKNRKVIVLEFNKDLSVKRRTDILKGTLGRIRNVVQGIDGNLYVLTDNGNNDQIVRLTAR